MNGTYHIIFAFLAGLALGAFFSLNLWSSVQKNDRRGNALVHAVWEFHAQDVELWLLGFYLVMDGHWERMIAALCGFVLMREILVRRLGKSPGVS